MRFKGLESPYFDFRGLFEVWRCVKQEGGSREFEGMKFPHGFMFLAQNLGGHIGGTTTPPMCPLSVHILINGSTTRF